jgi:hypothetical protein
MENRSRELAVAEYHTGLTVGGKANYRESKSGSEKLRL